MRFDKTKIAAFVVASVVIVLFSVKSASGVPLPQAEQQRIRNLAVLCTEAVSENWHYGNFTTVTDESILAECDDIFVDLMNQCDQIALVMEQCSDPAYDKYIVDRGLSSRIEPQQSVSTFGSPSFTSPADNEDNEDNEESTDEGDNNDEDEDN